MIEVELNGCWAEITVTKGGYVHLGLPGIDDEVVLDMTEARQLGAALMALDASHDDRRESA